MTRPPNQRQGIAFPAVFRLDIASGLFGVEFPDLPGCVASGRDFVQARDGAKHALDLWIDTSLGRGEAVPVPRAVHDPPHPAARTVWISSRSTFEQARRLSHHQPA